MGLKMNTTALAVRYSENRELANFRRTHAPEATNDEFDSFIAYCRVKKFDPIKGDAILVIYGKGDRRKATIITTQAGMRSMADRSGDYHPAKPGDTILTFTPHHLKREKLLADAINILEDGILKGEDTSAAYNARVALINKIMPINPANPFGLLECRTVVYKKGVPAEGIARWVEYAPLTPDPECFDMVGTGEYWQNKDGSSTNREKKRKVVRPGINPLEHLILDRSGKWATAGANQLHKCATVHALKAAFPDHYDHTFNTEETMDKTIAEERTASELAELGEQERRLSAVGFTSAELYAWADKNGDISHYPPNAYGDAVLRSFRECKFLDEYERLKKRNTEAFNRFWAMHKNDALDVKIELDKLKEKLPRRPEAVTIEHEGVPPNA